jgi:threonine efflux protein
MTPERGTGTTRKRGLWHSGGSRHDVVVQAVVPFLMLYAVNAMSPGPNMILIIQTAIGAGRRSAVAVALGVATGSSLLALVVAFGLDVFLTDNPSLVWALQITSIIYIGYLGFRMLWQAGRPVAMLAGEGRPHTAYGRGLATVVTNPQTFLFFVGALAGTIPPETPQAARLACAAGVLATSIVCHGGIAMAISSPMGRRTLLRLKPGLDLALGTLLILFAEQALLNTA